MVWRKVILSFILICCILLVAASGSPANAAEEDIISSVEAIPVMGSVSFEAVEYIRTYLFSHPLAFGKDYMLFSSDLTSANLYLFVTGSIIESEQYYDIVVDDLFVLQVVEGNGWCFFPMDEFSTIRVDNSSNFLLYSNVGNNLSIYDRSDIYAYVSVLMLATGIVCYLLRSIFNFVLRRK